MCNWKISQLQPKCNWKISVATNVQLKKSRLQQVCNWKNLGFNLNVTGKISVNISTMGKINKKSQSKKANILPLIHCLCWCAHGPCQSRTHELVIQNKKKECLHVLWKQLIIPVKDILVILKRYFLQFHSSAKVDRKIAEHVVFLLSCD